MASGTNGGIHGGAVCSLQDRLMYFDQRITLRRVRRHILDTGRKRKRSPADDASKKDTN